MTIGPRVVAATLVVLAGAMPCAAASAVLTNVQQIRALSREEAALAMPVRLRGVVVYRGWQDIVLHDGNASIYLDFRFAGEKGVWQGPTPDLEKLEPGTELEVGGVTDPGGFSPMVLLSKMQKVGVQPLPTPLHPTTEELLSSLYDTQWVEVEGVVLKLDNPYGKFPCLTLLVGGHPCQILFRYHLNTTRKQLVDARVRVRGVLMNIANLRSQTAGMKLHSNDVRDIEVFVPPPPDPFQAPHVALGMLSAYSIDRDLGHRRVSSGVVTFAVPGRFFYLRDHDACVRVNSPEAQVTPGDRIEVSGFVDTSRILAGFSEAIVRKVGTGKVPPPDEPSISQILDPKTRSPEEMVAEPGNSDFDGRTIRLTGVLRRVLPPDENGNTTVMIESVEYLVRALLPGAAPPWTEGSVVELTGVCELDLVRIDKLPWFSIAGFSVWLSSPSDVRVVSSPPWWTPRRLGILLAGLVLVLALSLIWGYSMRRQVAARGAELAQEISVRVSAQLEYDTILRERSRLASDLHDTLEQALTGLALQLEVASRSRSVDPAKSGHHLHLAQQFLEQSRSEVHRTVWALRAHGQDGRDFFEILDERIAAMVEGSGVTCTVTREGEHGPVEDRMAGDLVLLALEAVTNALKHARASEIVVLVRRSNGRAELVVTDNGCGFDVASAAGQREGHFGIQGMRERTNRLRGQFQVTSAPGSGTTVRVTVPLSSEVAYEPA